MSLCAELVAKRSTTVASFDEREQLKLREELGFSEDGWTSRNLAKLGVLDLHMARLRTLREAMFDERKVQFLKIDCSLNYFTQIPAELELFKDSLRSLDLSLNQIAGLSQHLGRLSNLRILKLARNGLQALNPSCLDGLNSLVELDLSNNVLEEITDLPSGLKNLKKLSLRGNRLEVVQGLKNLVNLSDICLANNAIRDILGLAFVRSLRIVDIASNKLDDLIEVRDVLLGLKKVEEVKLFKNPICSEKNYKMSILENANIKKLDNARVTPASFKKMKERSTKNSLDDLIERTSQHFIRWIQKENERKQLAVTLLHRKEAQLEKAFEDFKTTMEKDLDECVAYIQEAADNPQVYESFIGSIDGQKKWEAYILEAEIARNSHFEKEVSQMKAELENEVIVKAQSEAHLTKLRHLSETVPSFWRLIKERELATRIREEKSSKEDNDAFEAEQEASQQALDQRAKLRREQLLKNKCCPQEEEDGKDESPNTPCSESSPLTPERKQEVDLSE